MSHVAHARSGAMTAAALLGLLTGAIGLGSIFAGELVRYAPMPIPTWIARYERLRPVVEGVPVVGLWGRKIELFRAQYVLAPVVLKLVSAQGHVPPVVVVDVADPAERAVAVDWLREEAQRRGAVAEPRDVGRGIVVVDLRGRRTGP